MSHSQFLAKNVAITRFSLVKSKTNLNVTGVKDLANSKAVLVSSSLLGHYEMRMENGEVFFMNAKPSPFHNSSPSCTSFWNPDWEWKVCDHNEFGWQFSLLSSDYLESVMKITRLLMRRIGLVFYICKLYKVMGAPPKFNSKFAIAIENLDK